MPTRSDYFPLIFALPDVFHRIDLTEHPTDRARHLADRLQANLHAISEDELACSVIYYQHMIERMVNDGIIYAANFVGRSEYNPTAASTALFTVSVRNAAPHGTRTLEETLQALGRRRNCEACLIDLSIGRGLTVVTDDYVNTPANFNDPEQRKVVPTRQIQVLFPLTDRGQLASFALATECLSDWNDYVGMMAETTKTISWREPDEGGSVGAVLDGLT